MYKTIKMQISKCIDKNTQLTYSLVYTHVEMYNIQMCPYLLFYQMSLYHPEIELCASPMATGPRARLFMWNRYSNLASPASLASEDVLFDDFDVGWLDGIFMAWHGCMGWGNYFNIFSPLADGVLKISIYHDLAWNQFMFQIVCFSFCRALTVSVLRELAQSRFPRLQPANCSLQLQKEGSLAVLLLSSTCCRLQTTK